MPGGRPALAHDARERAQRRAIGPQARRLQDNDVITLAGVKMGFFFN